MFLSIVIPLYNAEKYISECLESCLNQDIDKSNYEIVIVNDGSTDSSLDIVRKYENTYSNIIVIDQENSGVSISRNNGIEKARGDYIWFVDSDDMIKPNCLQYLLEISRDDYDIINFGGYLFVNDFSDDDREKLLSESLESNAKHWGYACTHLYKRSIITNNNINFNPIIKYGEDELFYVDFYEKSQKVLDTGKLLYLYRYHENSAMSKLNSVVQKEQRIESIIISMNIVNNGLRNGKYVKDFAVDFLRERFVLCDLCLANIGKKRAAYYFEKMVNDGLFQKDKLSENLFPDANDFKKSYRAKQIRQYFKRFIPDSILKRLRNMKK